MEAEWELCRLEREIVIDAVASEDSDLFVLGCQTLIQLLNVRAGADSCDCTIVSGFTWTDYVNNILPEATIEETADFAVLLGCDYLGRAYGNSVKKVTSIFPNWRSQKESIIHKIETNGQVSGKRLRNGIPGCKETFRESSNIFSYASCFIMKTTVPELTIRQSFWQNCFTVSIGNLRDIPINADEDDLFGFNPDDCLMGGHSLLAYYSLDI